jgi:hypothetical protein
MSTEPLSGFRLVKKGGQPNRSEARLTIYANGGGYLSAPAVDALGRPPAVQELIDVSDRQLAFRAVTEDADNGYQLSYESDSAGADIQVVKTLRDLGIDPDKFDETNSVALVPHDDADDVLVADMSRLYSQYGSDDSLVAENSGPESSTDDTDASADVDGSESESQPDESAGDVTDHSSPQPDVPALDDEAASVTDKTRALFEELLDVGESTQLTCGDIADRIGEDGRGIPTAFRSLNGEYDIEQTDNETATGASFWSIRRVGDGEDTDTAAGENEDGSADDQDEDDTDESSAEIDHGDKPAVKYWCGFCGRGPFVREDQVEGHHLRNDHPGEPVIRTRDPTPDQTLDDGLEVDVDGDKTASELVADWIRDVYPDTRWCKTEDVAIECDISGNDAADALAQLEMDDFDVTDSGGMWHIAELEGDA